MRKLCVWTLAVGLCSAFSGALAMAADWTLLGERILNYRNAEEYIVARNDGAFQHIKLQVKSVPLEIKNVKVAFKDGTSFDATVDTFIAAGGYTKEINLPAAKSIERVIFTFKKTGGSDQLAVVRLLATQ